ncbi:hypothetical protein BV25DRAFT_1769449, partial [Artomyces pyxidatus]
KSSSSKNWTRVDNVWVSSDLSPHVLQCTTKPDQRPPKTDHVPILTDLDIVFDVATSTPRHNFHMTDWTLFQQTLSSALEAKGRPAEFRTGELAQFETSLRSFMDAVQSAVEKAVPLTQGTPYSKRWWTKELTDLRKRARTAGRRSERHRTDSAHLAHVAFDDARKLY